MKTTLLLFLGIHLSVVSGGSQFTSDKQKADWYFDLCEQYFPMGTSILNYHKKTLSFTKYARGNTEEDLVGAFGTVIHEAFHSFEGSFCGERTRCNGYMLADDIRITVKRTPVFQSPEMDAWIPDSLKSPMNERYDPYIVGDLPITAHVYGIYGLLEEMNAYYLGTEAWYALWDYFIEKDADIMEGFVGDYLWGVSSNLLALYEFRFFVAWYLDYAQQFHPEVYADIMANTNLRIVYTLLEEKYAILEGEFEGKVQEVIEMAERKGFDAEVEEGTFWLRKDGSGGGRGIFTDEMARLQNALTPHWQQMLNEFKLPKVNQTNWHLYITGN